MRDVRLQRKKSYLLLLRLSKLSSIFKTRIFQNKSHANYPLLHVPQVLYTLTPCLKLCTVFLEDEDSMHLAGTLGETQTVGTLKFLLQKPIYVMTFSATVPKKLYLRSKWSCKNSLNQVFCFKPCSFAFCGLSYGAQRFLL